MGFDTLFLNTLAPQDGEGSGGDATAAEDPGFDSTMVVSIDVAFEGNSPSGGLDNLTFVPEPNTWALLLIGSAICALGLRRRKR